MTNHKKANISYFSPAEAKELEATKSWERAIIESQAVYRSQQVSRMPSQVNPRQTILADVVINETCCQEDRLSAEDDVLSNYDL
jgi:hypothetical protein